jgi:hypothetical protein
MLILLVLPVLILKFSRARTTVHDEPPEAGA